MIIESYSEDDVLRELLDDYQSVTRKAKKLADKEIARLTKLGRVKDTSVMSHYVRSKNGNKWHILIVCKPNEKVKFIHQKHCVVELENGRRDFYYLRGLRFGPPYFVKIYSHALRRMRMRFCPEEGRELDTNPDVMCDKVAFHNLEQPLFMPLKAPELMDKDGKVSSNDAGLVITRAAAFVAYLSERGNYVFKTFLGHNELENSKKRPLFLFLRFLYGEMNPRAVADIMPTRKRIPLANQLVAMSMAFPETKPHVDHSLPSLRMLYL